MAASIDNSLLEGAKIHQERNLFMHLRGYCLNLQDAPQIEIVASGYAVERGNYVFVVYSIRNWWKVFCEGFAVNVGAKYNEIVSSNFGQQCTYVKAVVIPDSLYAYRFFIPSKHEYTEDLRMTAHRVDVYQ